MKRRSARYVDPYKYAGGMLSYYRFRLDNGHVISVEATSREHARHRAERNLGKSQIVEDLPMSNPRRSWSDKRTVEHYRRKFDYTKRPTGDKIGIHESPDAYLARIKRKYGVKSNPMRWSLYGGMENVGYSVLGRPIDKRSTAEAKAKAWSKLAHYPVEVKSGRKVLCVYVKGRKVRSNPIPAAVWAGIEAAPYVYAAGEATYHAGRAGLAAYRKYRASHKKRSRR